ncbi:MAG: tRNA-dihydrouridine synthase family protein [Muribaculaceae bacterium]|nr:tRNA-dihydrouridine synthase family protein [Muribaculaceae bacterium]
MTIDFAPLQGYTDAPYRRFHREIYGETVRYYYTPFIRVDKDGIRAKDIKDVSAGNNVGVRVIPQVIVNGIDEFNCLVEHLAGVGYKEIDVNMGCPFPLQVRRGRGAGMLSRTDTVSDVMCAIKSRRDISFSVKMRPGQNDVSECFRLLPLINETPLRCVVMHSRLGIRQYKSDIDEETFYRFYCELEHPLVYNGDICSLDDIEAVKKRFPSLSGVMIGRGLLSRPSLALEYVAGKEMERDEMLSRLMILHDRLYAHYSSVLEGDSHLLVKMKTFWDYLEPTIGHRVYKAINKSVNLTKYHTAISSIQ